MKIKMKIKIKSKYLIYFADQPARVKHQPKIYYLDFEQAGKNSFSYKKAYAR